MAVLLRRVLPLIVLGAAGPLAAAQEVANPYYTFWSRAKPGATTVYRETTRLFGAAAASAPEGTDVKTVTYKLVELNDDRAVVETRVLQQEIFGFVESAPTRHIYPARMSKAVLEDLLAETGAKGVEAVIKVGDREMKVMALAGKLKKGGEEVDFKIWLSDEVPGGIVKRVRVTKVNGEVAAETTVELVTFTTQPRELLPPADGLAALEARLKAMQAELASVPSRQALMELKERLGKVESQLKEMPSSQSVAELKSLMEKVNARLKNLESNASKPPCARITVRLPAHARLCVDGVVCPQCGDVRAFDTPSLDPDVRYTYVLTAEFVRDGIPYVVSRRIFMRAGDEVAVDLRHLFK
jgi:uncharacterized protein (TIGR03000 family)